MTEVTQFDKVRITPTPETERLGYAGQSGVCFGFTTPSVTGVTVIGDTGEDYALNVNFGHDDREGAWFAANLVEFIDHAPGTEISVGRKAYVRRADGSWAETRGAARAISNLKKLFKGR